MIRVEDLPRNGVNDEWWKRNSHEASKEDLQTALRSDIEKAIRHSKIEVPHTTFEYNLFTLDDSKFSSVPLRMPTDKMQEAGIELMKEYGLDETVSVQGKELPYGEHLYFPSQTIPKLLFIRSTTFGYDRKRKPQSVTWSVRETTQIPVPAAA